MREDGRGAQEGRWEIHSEKVLSAASSFRITLGRWRVRICSIGGESAGQRTLRQQPFWKVLSTLPSYSKCTTHVHLLLPSCSKQEVYHATASVHACVIHAVYSAPPLGPHFKNSHNVILCRQLRTWSSVSAKTCIASSTTPRRSSPTNTCTWRFVLIFILFFFYKAPQVKQKEKSWTRRFLARRSAWRFSLNFLLFSTTPRRSSPLNACTWRFSARHSACISTTSSSHADRGGAGWRGGRGGRGGEWGSRPKASRRLCLAQGTEYLDFVLVSKKRILKSTFLLSIVGVYSPRTGPLLSFESFLAGRYPNLFLRSFFEILRVFWQDVWISQRFHRRECVVVRDRPNGHGPWTWNSNGHGPWTGTRFFLSRNKNPSQRVWSRSWSRLRSPPRFDVFYV